MTPRPPAHVGPGNAKHPRRKSPAVGGGPGGAASGPAARQVATAALTGTTSPPSDSSWSSSGRSAEAPGGLCSSRTTSRSRPRARKSGRPTPRGTRDRRDRGSAAAIHQPLGEHRRSPGLALLKQGRSDPAFATARRFPPLPSQRIETGSGDPKPAGPPRHAGASRGSARADLPVSHSRRPRGAAQPGNTASVAVKPCT
jgi:hypothetical protein